MTDSIHPTTVRIEGNVVVSEAGWRRSFDLPVQELFEFLGLVVVCLEPRVVCTDIVALGTESGVTVWRLGEPETPYPGPFLGINPAGEGMLYAIHSSGITLEVEARTGAVVRRILAK